MGFKTRTSSLDVCLPLSEVDREIDTFPIGNKIIDGRGFGRCCGLVSNQMRARKEKPFRQNLARQIRLELFDID